MSKDTQAGTVRPTFFADSIQEVPWIENIEEEKIERKELPPIYYTQLGPITASGIVPFFKFKDKLYFLMVIADDGSLEILGGKTDEKDRNIFDTARREFSEETNHVLDHWLKTLPLIH